MNIKYIKFHGIYGDAKYEIGKDSVVDMCIENYSTQPHCGHTQLRVAYVGGLEIVRSLDGSNYDFMQDKK
jgi:hypothetical protein